MFSTGDIIALCAVIVTVLIFCIKSWLGSSNRKKELFQEIRNGILRIEKFLISKYADAANIFITSNSPASLTDKGKLLLEKSSGKKLIDDNIDFFISELYKTNPLTALDVENNAFEVIFKNTDKEIFKEVKDYIFNNPVFEGNQLNLSTIVKILSIYLRDKYFEKYPEILEQSESI
ncbi:MAG: hypothetical protein FJY10_12035 [Bacteroidetes bacterium]|nr:hypothetical protein [Bacteroidota bacterium]